MASLALGGALLVRGRDVKPQEAKPTRKRHEETFVTHEELREAVEKVAKDLEWEWTEMYEKFDKLHLRLAKREARQRKGQEAGGAQPDEPVQPVLDIRQFRRPGSM